MHCAAEFQFSPHFSGNALALVKSVGDWLGAIITAQQNTIEIQEGGGSIAIAQRPEDLVRKHLGSAPYVQLLNATPYTITSVLVLTKAVATNIPPFESATTPDWIFGLHQARDSHFVDDYIQQAITVTFERATTFTLTLNLSTAGAGSLMFYIVKRGIFVTDQLGDLRAVAWVT